MDRAADNVLSGMESLPSSPPTPPAVSLSSCLSLPVSCSSSPLSSSRQVTARLYSSLQHSREQEVKGHQADTHRSLTARQVSFKVTSPLVTMTTSAPSLRSDRLNESQEVAFGLDACSSSELRISGMEEAESEPEPIAEEMDLNLQSNTKFSSGRRHIEEMENVRSHLQTILRARATDTHELLPCALQHLQDNESDSTSDLLSGVEDLFPRYSRVRADFDSAPFHSVSELQVIRESLERERARRKHWEQQLLAVQSKALGLQQQLALAVSADRKKDIMIEQLDKTLEKVVEGWRRHEREKSEGVRRLQEEKEAAESTQQKQREVLACLEKSLSEAAETLDKEQKRNEELQNTNKQLECEMAELRVCVGELEQEVERVRAEVEEEKAEVERLQTHNLDLQQQLEQHNLQSKHIHTHLQQELTLLTQQLETERERVNEEVQLHEEAQSRLQQLQQDLEETKRERDTARVDRALDQARFEAQRSQWEVELRLSVEQQVTERLATIQEENANATAKLREQHRKQLLDLSARHERELSVQSDEFGVQLKERDDRQHQLTLHFNKKYTTLMAELQDELVSMETSKRRLETQREELVSRLQGMMRSHWAEALRLLTNQEQIEGVLTPLSLWDKPHSSPRTQDTSICSTAHTLSTAAPQAVVLQLCRERGTRGQGDSGGDRGRVESDFSLLNHSHTFSPLEPVLDDTHLTAVGGGDGDLWDRPVGGERQTVDRGTDGGKEQRERGETTHFHTQNLYCHLNQTRVQSDHRVNTQPIPTPNLNPFPNPTLNSNLRLNRAHASTDVRVNQSSDKGVGRFDVSKQMYSSTGTKAPPTEEQTLSVNVKAPPPATNVSSSCDERQNELQYYIAKLLERSPGEPLEEHQVDQSKNKAETLTTNSGVSSEIEPKLEQLAKLLHLTLPPTHTTQQLQQLLHSYIRSGEMCADTVRANLDRRLAQHDSKEVRQKEESLLQQRQSVARSMQNTTTRGRRTGPQGQRSGSKVNAWR
ncbi:centrobin isoform X3 [Ictalurus punctatus]|uniref:Centrobin isoform X3 n=1 Tax=Ictalurus punctatus TaxID=7998 RepID=A0A9F7RC47_ICTPU|nr:centrobin isoform X3 [Ictalurus punctatus]